MVLAIILGALAVVLIGVIAWLLAHWPVFRP